jgi:hypothetical protein
MCFFETQDCGTFEHPSTKSAHVLGLALPVKSLGFGRVSTKKTAPFYVHDDTCTQVDIMCRYGLDHWYAYIRPILTISSV